MDFTPRDARAGGSSSPLLDVKLGGGSRICLAFAPAAAGPIHLHERAAATRTGAGGTTEAVIAGHDLAIVNLVRIYIPEKK